MKWIAYFFSLFLLIPIILCKFFLRASLRHFDKHHARAIRRRRRKHPSSGTLAIELSRCCTYLVILVPFGGRVWYPSAVQPFYKSLETLRKEQALLLDGVRKIAVAVDKPTSATSGTLFSIRKSYLTNYLQVLCMQISQGFCDIPTTECSFMLCCCRPQVRRRKILTLDSIAS